MCSTVNGLSRSTPSPQAPSVQLKILHPSAPSFPSIVNVSPEVGRFSGDGHDRISTLALPSKGINEIISRRRLPSGGLEISIMGLGRGGHRTPAFSHSSGFVHGEVRIRDSSATEGRTDGHWRGVYEHRGIDIYPTPVRGFIHEVTQAIVERKESGKAPAAPISKETGRAGSL